MKHLLNHKIDMAFAVFWLFFGVLNLMADKAGWIALDFFFLGHNLTKITWECAAEEEKETK